MYAVARRVTDPETLVELRSQLDLFGRCNVHFELRIIPPFQNDANGRATTTQPVVKGSSNRVYINHNMPEHILPKNERMKEGKPDVWWIISAK